MLDLFSHSAEHQSSDTTNLSMKSIFHYLCNLLDQQISLPFLIHEVLIKEWVCYALQKLSFYLPFFISCKELVCYALQKLSLSLYCFWSVKFSWVCYALQKLSFLPTVFDQWSSHQRNGFAMPCKKLSFSLPFLISEVLIKKCVCYSLQKNSCFRKTWVLKNPYTWCKSCIEI